MDTTTHYKGFVIEAIKGENTLEDQVSKDRREPHQDR
jgi:hypothetical protein